MTGIPPVAGPLIETLPEALRTEPSPPGATLTDTALADTALTDTSPVFVDATGWRARFGRRLGLAAGAVLVVFLGALGLGMATGPSLPMTPWSEPSGHPPVQVTTPDVGSVNPGDQRAAGRPRTPAAGASPAPSAPPTPAARGTSAVPAPVPSTTRPGRSQASPPASPPAWGRKKKSH